ncbi:MAG: hypothetical protein Q8R92_16880 [Deltaproteobacteria bacterium]|nr:hypothetical protein [Deltaproteobacteria bacterium]
MANDKSIEAIATEINNAANDALCGMLDIEGGVMATDWTSTRVALGVLRVLARYELGNPEVLERVMQSCQQPFAHLEELDRMLPGKHS